VRRGRWIIVVTCAALALPAAANAQTRIVGGSPTTIEDWPWQVAIADPPSTGGDGYDRQFCGGSLVAPTVVVTAAHCVSSESGQFLSPNNFYVFTGRTTLSTTEGAEIAAVDVVYPIDGGGGTPVPESQLAPGQGPALYDPDTSQWDFALLELASAAPPPAEVIPLATASDWTTGDSVWITGWGDTSPGGGSYADVLQEAEVKIVDQTTCANQYALAAIAIDPVTMVCAADTGKDTCAGDSGGPMVKEVTAGAWRLVGDTSFGVGCAVPAFPGVYGRLGDQAMRGAVLAGITFAETTGGATGDTKAPETTIDKHPRKRSRRRRARFAFHADEAGVRFECAFDGKGFAGCQSPLSRRVSRRRHTFAVRAVDAADNVDQGPATFSWKVRKRH
jgi:hypothetical protein